MADAQVAQWLRAAGLSRFAPRFAAALISPTIFLSLAPSDLDALGVDSPADRKRLSDLIADLRRTSDLVPPAATATAKPPPLPAQHHDPSPTSQLHHHHHSLSALGPHSAPRASTLSSVRSHADARHVLESLSDRNAPFSAHHHNHHSTHNSLHRANTPSSAPAASAPTRRLSSRPSHAPVMRDGTATVTVCVRKRPLSRKELASSDRDIVSVNSDDGSLHVHELKEKVDLTKYVDTHSFSFDNVFGEHVGNAAVYNGTARPLVDTLFSGGRATCFAYGQTGAGKTFTMAGDGAENPGLYTLAVKDVFDRIRDIESDLWRKAEEEGVEDFEPPDPPQVWISFYEIYASRLQDLLNRGTKLECREDANNEVQIVGLAEKLCEVEEDVLDLIERGSAQRSTGTTGANDDSSRSHAIFQIELRDPPVSDEVADTNARMRDSLLRGTNGKPAPPSTKGEEIGRLCFIDLAGSERGSDTASSTRQTRMEGAEINKSLLALKECIRAMDKKKDHTPFRGSKLTQVLKASFLGKNCRTVMIANISPASSNVEHTLNTLRYSDRVKEIKKERGSGTPSVETSKFLGIRRATFAHGIGGSTRSARSTFSSFAAKSSIAGTENESPDEMSSKYDSVGVPNVEDLDEAPAKPPRPEPTRRTKSRARVRISEVQPSAMDAGKPRESRLARRRTSKLGPSRPSLGGTLLPRPPSKATLPDRVRTTSSTRGEKISPATSPDADSDSNPRGKRLSRAHEPDTKPPPPSPALTRGRARQLQAIKEDDKSSDSYSDSREEDSSAEPDDNADSGQDRRKKSIRASNVAESAMKFYQTQKKDELEDEDLLFASSDDLADGLDEDIDQRLLVVSDGITSGKTKKSRGKPKTLKDRPADDYGGNDISNTRQRPQASGSESETTKGASVGSRDAGDDDSMMRSVIRMHHMQIEELMRLTEADVALVNAAERGEMDAQEYALKLGVNLSQKLDIVKTLQSKLKALA